MAWRRSGFDSPWVHCGGVAERLKAAVLKTAIPKGIVGSNPTPTAPRGRLHNRHGFGMLVGRIGEPFALPSRDGFGDATLAQLVEQCFRKAKVPGSNPGGGSRMVY